MSIVGKKSYPDPEFRQKVLTPLEKQANQGFEILLRDPVFKNSSIIKDPAKLAEGFNRSRTEEDKKDTQQEAKNVKRTVLSSESAKGGVRPLISPASASTLDIIASERAKILTPLNHRKKLEEIDYHEINRHRDVALMHETNVALEVKLEFKKQK